MKYTAYTLKKIENIFKEGGFKVRYGRGNFQSGYCILKDRHVVVVNKLFDVEGRISCLIDLMLNKITLAEDKLSEASLKMHKQIVKEAEKIAKA